MSAGLPSVGTECCPVACDEVVVQNIPGPVGDDGADGTDGADGASCVTALTVAFTMPAELASDTANVGATAGFVIGENVFVQGLGTLQVTAIGSATQMTLKNLEDAATSAYSSNAAPTTVAAIGSRVGMTGLQGPAGVLSGDTAGGDLKGTYPNPLLLIPNALGALAVGNGTDANSLSAGTNGQIPAYDSTQPLGLIGKSIIPVTGGTNVAADRLVRLSSTTGTPIPLAASKASLKDPGGLGVIVADASAGNARGTDAVDLQVTRPTVGVAAVASGAQSVITGGVDNTASGSLTFIGGGELNLASNQGAVIAGGKLNQVDSLHSTVGGGEGNTILGGSAKKAFIGGGLLNAITGLGASVIAGGESNALSSHYAAIVGGLSNTVSGTFGAIAGGTQALADKYGQRAFAAGRFAAQADCQQSDLIWRISTTNSTIAEAFLDGAALRATIASGRSLAFEFLIVGRSSAGVSAAWRVVGAIQNNAGTTALVSAVTTTVIADGTGGTWGVVGGVTIDADDPNDALRVRVTGAAATLIRWAITARLMELGY